MHEVVKQPCSKGLLLIWNHSKIISEAIKVFRAPIKMNPHQNFGFASDIFDEPRFINELNLKNSQLVEGKAILSLIKRKMSGDGK